MMAALALLAEGEAAGGGSALLQFAPFIVIAILFWFMMMRPAQRQEKERRAMIAALKKNDEVLAAGGIIGTVVHIREKTNGQPSVEDEVKIKLDDKGSTLRIYRGSITRVLAAADNGTKDSAEKPNG
jgi:preprotein translocase subunit YajC